MRRRTAGRPVGTGQDLRSSVVSTVSRISRSRARASFRGRPLGTLFFPASAATIRSYMARASPSRLRNAGTANPPLVLATHGGRQGWFRQRDHTCTPALGVAWQLRRGRLPLGGNGFLSCVWQDLTRLALQSTGRPVVARTRSRVIAVMPSKSVCGLSGFPPAVRRGAKHVGKRRILATVTVGPARVTQAGAWFRLALQS